MRPALRTRRGGTWHTPALHVTAEGLPTFGFVVQSLPHVPQFFGSVCRFVHALSPGHDCPASPMDKEHPPPPIVRIV